MRYGFYICFLLRVIQMAPAHPLDALKESEAIAKTFPMQERLALLRELAVASAGVDLHTSREYAMQMYTLAGELKEGMNRDAELKNAVTVLSLSDPDKAAE